MVMVSHSKKFIFLKTRKTAGTSIELLLEPFCAPPGRIVQEQTEELVTDYGIVGARMTKRKNGDIPLQDSSEWRNHLPAAAVKNRLGNEIWSDYTKITAVRDPFDRMVSMFHWRKRNTVMPEGAALKAAFRRFLQQGWPDDAEVVMISNTYVPDRTIRFEHMADDLQRLFTDLDLPIDLTSMSHKKNFNKLRGGLTTDSYYDKQSADIVRRRMAWVFDNFDYPEHPTKDVSQREQQGLTP